MGIQITGKDKKALKDYVRNLAPFQRRYQDGARKGEFIFNTRLTRGDKAKAQGFLKDDKGQPLDDKKFYQIPISHVLEYPYDFFLRAIKKRNVPITPEILDDIHREYLLEYEAASLQYLQTMSDVKQETNSSKD